MYVCTADCRRILAYNVVCVVWCIRLHTQSNITHNKRSVTVCDIRVRVLVLTISESYGYRISNSHPSFLSIVFNKTTEQRNDRTREKENNLLSHYHRRCNMASRNWKKKKKIGSGEWGCGVSSILLFLSLPHFPLFSPFSSSSCLPTSLSFTHLYLSILLLSFSSSFTPHLLLLAHTHSPTHPFLSITLSNERLLTPSDPSKA